MNELLDMWREWRKLPIIEEHTVHCRQLYNINNKCICDRQKRIEHNVSLWMRLRNKLDELANV